MASKSARRLLRRLIVVLAIAWLGVSAAFAADDAATNVVTYSVAPPVASPLEEFYKHAPPAQANQPRPDHLQTIQGSFQQFFHCRV